MVMPPAFVAGPDAGELACAFGGAAVDSRLDEGEGRALQGVGNQDLASSAGHRWPWAPHPPCISLIIAVATT
jgi:hypothetical protein